MDKIDQIKQAIEKAIRHESKLSPEALSVPSFTSIKIRHLLNNLGAISTNYLDCGSHLGGSYCSAVFQNNLANGVMIDNFTEFYRDGVTKEALLSNAETFTPKETAWKLIEEDCFSAKDFPAKFDMILYDAGHSQSEQQRGVTYFKDYATDEYIFLVDDWQFNGVEEGTRTGIKLANLEVLFEEIWLTPEGAEPNMSFHNGYGIFYLKQKSQ
jgi:hypothetical protein